MNGVATIGLKGFSDGLTEEGDESLGSVHWVCLVSAEKVMETYLTTP